MSDADAPGSHTVIHTDGACIGNPGPGGWAAILQLIKGGKPTRRKEICGAVTETTNNRMELTAVIEALKTIKSDRPITIRSDSEYVVKGMTAWLPGWKARGWKTAQKKPVMNQDLWEALDELASSHTIAWEWVRGHNGDPLNEEVDRLANEAARGAN